MHDKRQLYTHSMFKDSVTKFSNTVSPPTDTLEEEVGEQVGSFLTPPAPEPT